MTDSTASKPESAFWRDAPLQCLLRLILGVVFLQSGIAKLGQITVFIQSVDSYALLPHPVAVFYGHLLPWLEVLAGSYLLLGLFLSSTAVLTGLLLVSFLIAIGSALVTGKTIDCGCMIGGAQEPVSWLLFFRDFLMLLGCVYLFKTPNRRFSVDASL